MQSTERITIPLSEVIPLGDMFVEGMASYYNPSIKANDSVVSKNSHISFTVCLIYLDF